MLALMRLSNLRTTAGIFCFYAAFAISVRAFSDWLLTFESGNFSLYEITRYNRRGVMANNNKTILTATTSVRRAMNEEATLTRKGYTIGIQIGEGSYAQVYSCVDERRKIKCAMKIVNRRKAPADFLQKFLPRELYLLKKVQHCNVIQLYEIFEFGSKVYISMEIAGHGDLLDYIKLRRYLSESSARAFFQQLVSGIGYLHQLDIVHRDLKCENILLSDNNEIKISDFGFARETISENLINTFCGSAAYAAPEVLQGLAYKGKQYDAWSLGVILYIMVCGTMPFDDSNIKRMIKDQIDQRISFTKKRTVTEPFRKCILAILEPDPEKRLTVQRMPDDLWIANSERDEINDVTEEESVSRTKVPVPERVREKVTVVTHQACGTQDAVTSVVTPSRRRTAPDDDADQSPSGGSSNKLPRL